MTICIMAHELTGQTETSYRGDKSPNELGWGSCGSAPGLKTAEIGDRKKGVGTGNRISIEALVY
ncbi:MAG: hypothetical protein DRQ24_11815 [Candidatus Latescibacterota bacterium]|nr:MAG: hypothetical protein DRQ24_11815 [Candidatus Latescibacterota bacterium]